MIVRIPIPEAWSNGKRYAMEFDSEKLSRVDTHRDVIPDGVGGHVFTGENQITLFFDKLEDGPKWIEVP